MPAEFVEVLRILSKFLKGAGEVRGDLSVFFMRVDGIVPH